ncbi:MAG: MFS transporter [Deltaproteobacteria bacterium]|nr:MFS transporter [Deltaproteobacteria bacterium]
MATRFAALQSRDFRLLCVGQAVSLTGSQMQQVAVVWQLYLVTHDPLSMGALGLFRVVPMVVLALGGGVVADALDRRKLMIAAQLALALSSLTLAAATMMHAVSAPIIYAAAAFAGGAAAFEIPARQSMLPRLVSTEELPNALSIYATVWQLAQIGGPALGGVVLARFGVMPIYVFDIVSFGAVIAAVAMMETREVSGARRPMELSAIGEGLTFLVRTPVILSVMVLDAVGTFFAGAMLLMPIFADQLLDVGPRGLGLLYAAQPAGAALVGTWMSARPPVRKQGLTVVSMVALYGMAIAVFGQSSSFGVALLALAISGGADTASMVVRQTLRQTLTPDSMRGRLTSINMIFAMGGPQLGEAEAGAVAKLFDARVSVISGGLICAAVAIGVALLAPGLRKYQTEPEALATET